MTTKNPPFLFLFAAIVFVWVQWSCESTVRLDLTNAEIKWIEEHPTIRLAVDQTYAPLNFKDETGNIVGLNIDLLQLVEERTGLSIELEGSTWDEALNKAMLHQVDGVINATEIDERKTKLNFTFPFTQDPQALVTNKSIEKEKFDYSTKTIAAKQNSTQLKFLKEHYPGVKIVEVNTLEEGLQLLSVNQVEGVYDDLAPLYHFIVSNNLNNLHINEIEFNNLYSQVALRNDEPLMLSIFNKAILSISQQERNAIKEKWLQVGAAVDLKYYYWVLGVLGVLVVLGFSWSWTLKVTVNRRTHQLRQELQEKSKVEKALKEQQGFNESMLESFPGIFFMYEMKKEIRLIKWNKNHEKVFNLSAEQLNGAHPLSFFKGNNVKKAMSALQTIKREGEIIVELTISTNAGLEIPYFLMARVVEIGGGKYFLGFGFDISERVAVRKELELHKEKLEILVKDRTEQLETKNVELQEKNFQISIQAAELVKLNERLNKVNENLEKLVSQRTEELSFRNEQLLKYSFDNAHKVRGPLARILGLLNLIELNFDQNSKECFGIIQKESKEMDSIVRAISKELYDTVNDTVKDNLN